MGLDMFLTARKYVSSHSDEALSTKMNQIAQNLGFPGEVSGITVEAMYWRKANAIHQWFVENVQGGVDDCRESRVEREDLVKLQDTIDRCLRDTTLAPELLPTQAGCFFGGLEYDEWYWQDLERTSTRLKEILEATANDWWEFHYHASW